MNSSPLRRRQTNQGFTLVEALMAIIVLSFGLISIANLMLVATSSNTVANRSGAATMLAAQQMEVLRSTRFGALTVSPTDSLDVDQPGFFTDPPVIVPGVGTVTTRWRIQVLANANSYFIQVRSEPQGFRGRWARAEFTTVRSCVSGTTAGCPL